MGNLKWGIVPFVLVCAAMGMPAAGCGGDDSTPQGGGTGGSAGAGGSASGKGGTGGAGGASAGTGGTGGGDASTGPLMACGTMMCAGSPFSFMGTPITLPACCPAEEPTACGVVNLLNMKCISKAQHPTDPSCPGAMVMGAPLPGCCLANGKCGVNAAAGGFGCADPDALNTSGMASEAGAPQSCTPGAGEGGTTEGGSDATTSDAGSDSSADSASEASTEDAAGEGG